MRTRYVDAPPRNAGSKGGRENERGNAAYARTHSRARALAASLAPRGRRLQQNAPSTHQPPPRYHHRHLYRQNKQPVVVAFDQRHELLWAGAASGTLYTLQLPTLEPYAFWRGHPSGCVSDLVPHSDGAALSVSADALTLHTAGGVQRMRVPRGAPQAAAGGGGSSSSGDAAAAAAAPDEEWACCTLEPGQAHSRVLVGGSGGGVTSVDLVGAKRVSRSEIAQEAVVFLRATAARGAVVAGTESGRVLLGDARRGGLRADHGTLAHPGGLACLDARGDMVATCGYSVRMGVVRTLLVGWRAGGVGWRVCFRARRL